MPAQYPMLLSPGFQGQKLQHKKSQYPESKPLDMKLIGGLTNPTLRFGAMNDAIFCITSFGNLPRSFPRDLTSFLSLPIGFMFCRPWEMVSLLVHVIVQEIGPFFVFAESAASNLRGGV